jgi:hypothetical protein
MVLTEEQKKNGWRGVGVFAIVVFIIFVVWISCALSFHNKHNKGGSFNDSMIFNITAKAPFTDMLEATLAPGAQQRYDTSLSHTGADGNTENQKLNISRSHAMPVVAKSGLTGSREAPYFPEGSMYNIEGKRVGASVSAGEGFRSKFDAAKLEENVYG